LSLRANRHPAAWWILAPLACVFAVELGMKTSLEFLPSQALDEFCQVARALAFGLAAVWLASAFLANRHRFLTALSMLGLLGASSLFAYAVTQSWTETGGEEFIAAIYLGIFALALVTALSLAGLSCRRRFQAVRLLVWLLIWLAAAFTVIIAPFLLFALFAGGGEALAAFGGAVLVSTLVGFALVLPFLILSIANGFYRERLCRLLRMEIQPLPPLLAIRETPAPAT
jgi:hypothetical protein